MTFSESDPLIDNQRVLSQTAEIAPCIYSIISLHIADPLKSGHLTGNKRR